jgi:hypothetical protein
MDFVCVGVFVTIDLLLQIRARLGRWKSSFFLLLASNLKEKKNGIGNTIPMRVRSKIFKLTLIKS